MAPKLALPPAGDEPAPPPVTPVTSCDTASAVALRTADSDASSTAPVPARGRPAPMGVDAPGIK